MMPNLTDDLGLECIVTQHDHKTIISFIPKNDKCPVPSDQLRILLTVLAFRAIMGNQNDDSLPKLMIKWLGRPLWFGHVVPNLTAEALSNMMTAAAMTFSGTAQYRVLHKAKHLMPEQKIQDCEPSEHRAAIMIYLAQEMHGGAPTGSKQNARLQMKNSIASTLLQEGYDLTWVSDAVEQALNSTGMRELAPVSAMPPSPKRLEAIIAILKQCAIDIPKVQPQKTSQAAMQARQKKKPAIMPCPNMYRVAEGFLLKSDGEVAQQLQEFNCQHSGFYLCDANFALPWLRANETISTDEIALVLFGEPPLVTTLDKSHVTLPFLDEHGQSVLIACTLIQLGEKAITPKKLDDHIIDGDSVTLTAITLWKEDWGEDWNTIAQNPIAHIKKTINDPDAIVSIWGKAFRKGKQPATCHDCTSIQMHCTIRDSKIGQVLSSSGHNSLWATPKSENGQINPKWKLIWLEPGQSKQQAIVASAKVQGASGLVRSHNRYAIRIAACNFSNAWKQLYPNIDEPMQINATRTFKLENLPFGTTAKMIAMWAEHQGWKIRPYRALGPKGWLIGADAPPNSSALSFNGSPILVRELPGRYQASSSPIMAGPKPLQKNSRNVSQPTARALDPWANYVGTAAMVADKPATGPTANKFQQHEQRMQQIEETLTQLKQDQLAQHQAQEDFQLRLETETKQRELSMQQHIEARLDTFRTELDQSFTSALQAQSQHFDTNLSEIKQLLIGQMASAKRKEPERSDADMSNP